MNSRLVLLLVLAGGGYVVVRGVLRAVRASALDRVGARVRLRSTLVTGACFVLVALFIAFSPVPATEEVRLATLPAVAGFVGVVAAGWSERLWRRPVGQRRVASLRIRDRASADSAESGDQALARRYVAGLVTSAVLVVIGAVSAAPDGRGVERRWSTGAAAAGPYPGWHYGQPILVALAVLSLGTWWALRRVDGRPVLDVDRPDLDRALRVGSRVRVLRFAAGGALLSAAGLALSAGASLARLAQNLRMGQPGAPAAQAPWDWTQNAGFALLALGLVALVVALRSMTWPAPTIPTGLPASAALGGVDRAEAAG